MTAELEPNSIVRPYRGVSVQSVPSLVEAELVPYLLSRRVYRRTEFLVAECGGSYAVVRVERAPGDEILVPVAAVTVVASGAQVAFVEDAGVDTGNATQLARAAAASGVAADVYVVQGRFQHVNFIVRPAPVVVRVVEVIPPWPPKLLDMAQAMLDVDEDLPPIDLQFDAIDLRDLMADSPADVHLLPCRSGGLSGDVEFLDEGPDWRDGRTLVGCERSRQIHAAMYGRDAAAVVDFCPRVRVSRDGEGPTLLKCCLRERGIERRGTHQVMVPWGATLDEVRAALRVLCGLPAMPASPAVEVAS